MSTSRSSRRERASAQLEATSAALVAGGHRASSGRGAWSPAVVRDGARAIAVATASLEPDWPMSTSCVRPRDGRPAWKSTVPSRRTSQYARPALDERAVDARRGLRAGVAAGRGARYVTNAKRRAVLGDVLLAGDLRRTRLRSQLREERVAVDVEVDLGEQRARRRAGAPRRRSPRRRSRRPRSTSSSELERLLERAGTLRARRRSTPGLRVTTTLRRPGSGRKRSGSESHVFRPMTTACPVVSSLKRAMSSGRCHGIASVAADHAAARDGSDERDRHTATGARIAGWCS